VTVKRLHVAVVDDEAQVRRGLERVMRGAGFDAVTWSSGDAFLRALAQHPPDCVVLDLQMPGLGGFEVLSLLQKCDCPIPAIVITGHDADDTAGRALAAGAFAFLRKPVDSIQLIDEVSRAIAARSRPSGMSDD
jgi:FixJ family two-component response regulator